MLLGSRGLLLLRLFRLLLRLLGLLLLWLGRGLRLLLRLFGILWGSLWLFDILRRSLLRLFGVLRRSGLRLRLWLLRHHRRVLRSGRKLIVRLQGRVTKKSGQQRENFVMCISDAYWPAMRLF